MGMRSLMSTLSKDSLCGVQTELKLRPLFFKCNQDGVFEEDRFETESLRYRDQDYKKFSFHVVSPQLIFNRHTVTTLLYKLVYGISLLHFCLLKLFILAL